VVLAVHSLVLLFHGLQCLPTTSSPPRNDGGSGSTTGNNNVGDNSNNGSNNNGNNAGSNNGGGSNTGSNNSGSNNGNNGGGSVTGSDNNAPPASPKPDDIKSDLTCGCGRAPSRAAAVSQAIASSGGNCNSPAGQALAGELPHSSLGTGGVTSAFDAVVEKCNALVCHTDDAAALLH
jgi:hypothetical protein